MYIKTIIPFLFLYRFYTSPVCRGNYLLSKLFIRIEIILKTNVKSNNSINLILCVLSLFRLVMYTTCRITDAVCACLCVQDALLLLQLHKTALHMPLTE